MPTPYDAPYKVAQRILRKRAKELRYSKEWYEADQHRQQALVNAHKKKTKLTLIDET